MKARGVSNKVSCPPPTKQQKQNCWRLRPWKEASLLGTVQAGCKTLLPQHTVPPPRPISLQQIEPRAQRFPKHLPGVVGFPSKLPHKQMGVGHQFSFYLHPGRCPDGGGGGSNRQDMAGGGRESGEEGAPTARLRKEEAGLGPRHTQARGGG